MRVNIAQDKVSYVIYDKDKPPPEDLKKKQVLNIIT